MARNTQEPERIDTPDAPHTEYHFKHPAYAQAHASRVTGHTTLYGSDFTHSHYITLSISYSEEHRSLSRSWHFPRGEIIEVSMSESQWATLVSSLNHGSGVPVTISRYHGKGVPGIEQPKKVELFAGEVAMELNQLMGSIQRAKDLFEDDANKMSAAVRERMKRLLWELEAAMQSGLPFVTKQFSEHMENTVEAAKAEVHAYAQATLSGLGIERLDQLKELERRVEEGADAPKPKLVLKRKTSDSRE